MKLDIDQFPNRLYGIYYEDEDLFYCIKLGPELGELEGLRCLPVFSTFAMCSVYLGCLDEKQQRGAVVRQMTFEEARIEAQSREPVEALLLVDDPENLRIHYVR